MGHDEARERAAMPQGSGACLNTRSLASSHRRLADVVRPGMAVLDVGCGSGAITRGIAEAVAPGGQVVGIDRDESLIAEARQKHHGDVPAVSFEVADAYELPYRHTFDVVTAARVLQWLDRPQAALQQMIAAARPGGTVLILDYNHEKLLWKPRPPETVGAFYQRFLKWRADAGMDNAMADHLPQLLADAGLQQLHVSEQHEDVRRGDPDFPARAGIWQAVIHGRGRQLVKDGFLTESQRAAAEADYGTWMENAARRQRMYLLAVEGQVPGPRGSGV